jgi:hypothetical protein
MSDSKMKIYKNVVFYFSSKCFEMNFVVYFEKCVCNGGTSQNQKSYQTRVTNFFQPPFL